jgi:HAD superfamily hydrolase (TIGR01509 family)
VLIDSERIWESARRDLVTEYGLPYPPGTTRAIMGMSAPEWSHYVGATLGVPLPEAAIDANVVARVAAAYRRELPLLPGARECVSELARRRPLGLASSSNRSLIELALELAGLRAAFSAVVSAEEVGRGKPAPDVYLRAAELLGVAPTACAAIEDSSNGIRSAAAAGMLVIAIPNREFPPLPDALALAAIQVDDLAGVAPALSSRF